MIDKKHLQDKRVAFRLIDSNRIHIGVVKVVEDDGFWIDSAPMIGEMLEDSSWKRAVSEIQKPVLFVPTSSLMFLIAAQE
jgi:ferredoxin-fold anticodon binding domain-containing protein